MTELAQPPLDMAAADILQAVAAADSAFTAEQREPTFEPQVLLRSVAARLAQARSELILTAHEETNLAEARLDGELTRTTTQLDAFAEMIDHGLEHDAIIDTAEPDSTPPKPDQRRVSMPIGPVAVFAASNFPLAFSVAGGDTASAWAAGCPVLLKAHPAHPLTSELTASAVAAGLGDAGAPQAWLQMVSGASVEVGMGLVNAPAIQAVAFTGSYAGGIAIARAAAERPVPIPAYCEMGSINPFVITPHAARTRAETIAVGLAQALTGSVGQLCTKPGVMLLVDDRPGRALVAALTERLREVAPAKMLYPALRDRYERAIAAHAHDPRIGELLPPAAHTSIDVPPVLLETRAAALKPGDSSLEEIFGPAGIVVWAQDEAELLRSLELLPGSLTATVHAAEHDPLAAETVRRLVPKAGRIIHNGYPTGVTVGHATVHGGPFPATTMAASTSVGMTAVRRFQRPVGFQEMPDALLPAALQDANPLSIFRRVNGVVTSAGVIRA